MYGCQPRGPSSFNRIGRRNDRSFHETVAQCGPLRAHCRRQEHAAPRLPGTASPAPLQPKSLGPSPASRCTTADTRAGSCYCCCHPHRKGCCRAETVSRDGAACRLRRSPPRSAAQTARERGARVRPAEEWEKNPFTLFCSHMRSEESLCTALDRLEARTPPARNRGGLTLVCSLFRSRRFSPTSCCSACGCLTAPARRGSASR